MDFLIYRKLWPLPWKHGYRALNAVNMEEKKISNSLQRTLHFDYVQQFLSEMN